MYFHPFEMIQQRRHIVRGFLLQANIFRRHFCFLFLFLFFGLVLETLWKLWGRFGKNLRMITGGLRLHNSDLVLENCMVTGTAIQSIGIAVKLERVLHWESPLKFNSNIYEHMPGKFGIY